MTHQDDHSEKISHITLSIKSEESTHTMTTAPHSEHLSNSNKLKRKMKRRPLLFKIRASKTFVFWTAAVGLFTSTFVHSILFPLSPFIVARIRNLDKDGTDYATSAGITENIEMTSHDTGILVALYAVGLLCGSPIFGYLGDRIKQRRLPMLLGTGASMAANVLFMVSTTYPMLLVARFLQGASNACVWTMCLCLIAENWPKEELGVQMGKLVGFYPLGMMVGLPVGVLYSELGHAAPFIASMCLSGLDMIMRLILIERSSAPPEWFSQDTKVNDATQAAMDQQNDIEKGSLPNKKVSEEAEQEEATPAAVAAVRKPSVTWFQLLKQPRLIVSLSLTMIVAIVISAFEPVMSMRMAQEWGFDAAGCSLIVLAFMIPSIIASPICGWLCDRYGTKIVALVALTLATPSCIMIGYPNAQHGPFWLLIPVLTMGGINISACQAAVYPEIAKVVEKENKNPAHSSDGLARSYSLFNAAYAIGMCVGPLMAGYLYVSIGFFWLCTLLSTFFFSFIPLAYLYVGDDRRLIAYKKTAAAAAAAENNDIDVLGASCISSSLTTTGDTQMSRDSAIKNKLPSDKRNKLPDDRTLTVETLDIVFPEESRVSQLTATTITAAMPDGTVFKQP